MRHLRHFAQFAVIMAALAALLTAAPRSARAAELVMFEQKGCVWCERWREQIGPVYPKTSEGKIAPLRQVDIDGEIPGDLAGIPVDRLTPTFVLVENGVEIDRLRGYPGDEFFWFLLDNMLKKLPDGS